MAGQGFVARLPVAAVSLKCRFTLHCCVKLAVFTGAQNDQIQACAVGGGLDAGKEANPAVSFPSKAQGLTGLGPLTKEEPLAGIWKLLLHGELARPSLGLTQPRAPCAASLLLHGFSVSHGVAAALHGSFASVSKAMGAPNAWPGLLLLAALT